MSRMVEAAATGWWKLGVAAGLLALILVALLARPPARPSPAGELRRLVLAAVCLYGVGGLASVTHRPLLAGLLYASGIATCTLAAWLSRAGDSGQPPSSGEDEPHDDRPPPQPDDLPGFDWSRFEAEFRAFSQRSREREHSSGR